MILGGFLFLSFVLYYLVHFFVVVVVKWAFIKKLFMKNLGYIFFIIFLLSVGVCYESIYA